MNSIKTVHSDGTITWRHPKTNDFHRVDGPAIEYSDGTKRWYLNGLLHRADGGPAVEYPDGYEQQWFLNGEELTKDEFKRWYLFTHLREYKG